VELGRVVRRVCRRHLARLQRAGCPLACEAAEGLQGRWDGAWTERMIEGLVSMSLQFVPDTSIDVTARRSGDDAIVEVRYTKPAAGDRPALRAPVDLARLTAAHEEWALEFWLWRGLARTQGAQLSLLPGRRGPDGLSLILPLDRTACPI
jgi:hypothetical protein